MVNKQEIIHLFRVDGQSIRAISRRMGISRPTVTKVIREYQSSLEEDSPSAFEDVLTTRPSYNVSTRKRTVMKGAVVELIGKCLKENE